MKRKKKSEKIVLSLHIYGIFDKRMKTLKKVSLDPEDIIWDVDLDNMEGNLEVCDFNVKVQIPI